MFTFSSECFHIHIKIKAARKKQNKAKKKTRKKNGFLQRLLQSGNIITVHLHLTVTQEVYMKHPLLNNTLTVFSLGADLER